MSTGTILTMTYGDRIRRARLSAGLTQEEFAEQVGVDTSLVGRHEKLDAPPSRNRRALAAMIQLRYGIDADWLLTGESPRPVRAEGDLVAGAGFEPATSGLRASQHQLAQIIPIQRTGSNLGAAA